MSEGGIRLSVYCKKAMSYSRRIMLAKAELGCSWHQDSLIAERQQRIADNSRGENLN